MVEAESLAGSGPMSREGSIQPFTYLLHDTNAPQLPLERGGARELSDDGMTAALRQAPERSRLRKPPPPTLSTKEARALGYKPTLHTHEPLGCMQEEIGRQRNSRFATYMHKHVTSQRRPRVQHPCSMFATCIEHTCSIDATCLLHACRMRPICMQHMQHASNAHGTYMQKGVAAMAGNIYFIDRRLSY